MSKELKIATHQAAGIPAGVTVLKLCGSLDANTVGQLEETIALCIKEKKVLLVFDLADLDYVSSAGMGLLIGMIDDVRAQGGDMKMVNPKPNVLKVFEILGFDKIFTIFHDMQSACKAR